MPAVFAAFSISEVFYKFHAFILECLAFQLTWFVFSWVDRIDATIGTHQLRSLCPTPGKSQIDPPQ